MRIRNFSAALVHVYTALGLVFAFRAALALLQGDLRSFFVALFLAVLVDASDGTLARRLRVREVLPQFNGRRLDDIIDYLTYVFLPALGLVVFGVLPQSLAWVAVLPLLASAYGFSQEQAKTEQSFVGFPSYWNVVLLYLYILDLPALWAAGVLIVLSALVFVPLHYVYPSQTRFLQRLTLLVTGLYGVVIAAVCFFPQADWARSVMLISLIYPLYYAVISVLLHRQTRRSQRASEART